MNWCDIHYEEDKSHLKPYGAYTHFNNIELQCI